MSAFDLFDGIELARGDGLTDDEYRLPQHLVPSRISEKSMSF